MDMVKSLALDFCEGKYDRKVSGKLWATVFEYLRKNVNELTFDREAIHTLWTVNGGALREKLKNDDLLLDVLLIFLPKYVGEEMILYRGECRFLYEENKIGFCWTPKQEVAEMFAGGRNAIESGGVLLKAVAPKEAIISAPNDHSANQMGEFEYTCNSRRLKNIQVVRIYEKC